MEVGKVLWGRGRSEGTDQAQEGAGTVTAVSYPLSWAWKLNMGWFGFASSISMVLTQGDPLRQQGLYLSPEIRGSNVPWRFPAAAIPMQQILMQFSCNSYAAKPLHSSTGLLLGLGCPAHKIWNSSFFCSLVLCNESQKGISAPGYSPWKRGGHSSPAAFPHCLLSHRDACKAIGMREGQKWMGFLHFLGACTI